MGRLCKFLYMALQKEIQNSTLSDYNSEYIVNNIKIQNSVWDS